MMKNMAENLFNYAMSFTSDSKSIPISTIEMWFRNTQAKLSNDPNYFKKWRNSILQTKIPAFTIMCFLG